MGQGTPIVEYNIPTGLGVVETGKFRRPDFNEVTACSHSLASGARRDEPKGLADFGPALRLGEVALVGENPTGLTNFDLARVGYVVADGSTSSTRVKEVSPVGSPKQWAVVTGTNLNKVNEALNHGLAQSTLNNYASQWRQFLIWALGNGIQALPADPAQVAVYLDKRIEEKGHKPSSLRMAASAIAFVHKTAEMSDPCASPVVKKTLRMATRKAGRSQRQAKALTAEAFEAIRSTACKPRPGRGGTLESDATATHRGNLDLALIGLMRDAMLRVSEATEITLKDLITEPDGTGRLLIRRSKTDLDGVGAVAFVSRETMQMLSLIRNDQDDDDRVFRLRPNQISRRIKQAAEAAGLGDGFSGHSPRVGMARDLARLGIELPSLMNAGRWRSPQMPAHYTRNESAGRGAVAQFHGHYSPRSCT